MAPKLQVETKVFQVRSINILSFGVHAHWHKLHISRGYKKAWTADNGRESVFLIICQRLQSGEGPWFMSICCVILCTWNPWLTRGNSWFETIYNTESIHSSINKCFFLFFPNNTCPSDPRLQENIIWPDPPEQSPCYDTLLSGWFAGGLCILVKNIKKVTAGCDWQQLSGCLGANEPSHFLPISVESCRCAVLSRDWYWSQRQCFLNNSGSL